MKQQLAKIISNKMMAQDTFELVVKLDNIPNITPGQFAMLSVGTSEGVLLKRPLSIHDYQGDIITFLYTVKGKGTRLLSTYTQGGLEIILPLGKGFPLLKEGTKVVLLGGGMGVFPLYSVIRGNPQAQFYCYLGFRCKEQICALERFKGANCNTLVATDDGSFGKQGFVTDMLLADIDKIAPDIIFACGPMPMFANLKKIVRDIPTYISMEERMACGFGACLVCACATQKGYVRTCADGPVFNINEVVL